MVGSNVRSNKGGSQLLLRWASQRVKKGQPLKVNKGERRLTLRKPETGHCACRCYCYRSLAGARYVLCTCCCCCCCSILRLRLRSRLPMLDRSSRLPVAPVARPAPGVGVGVNRPGWLPVAVPAGHNAESA